MRLSDVICEQLRAREVPENTGICAPHNPKVAGMNPAPAMQEPLSPAGFCA
jgi:hypothetical protein